MPQLRVQAVSVERRYHIGDIRPRFRMPSAPHCYSPEYQRWFASGLRQCAKHPYPFQWHLMEYIECPKCREANTHESDSSDAETPHKVE